ncbi:hypothetical protein [Cysteiniphilum marinum]|uniref:hypothetical protein n=1 Tax=Cysteiniphilum marinum TaxID=2774191 RepID=UPI00193AFC1A|nr:hypothetical protein [Cysteiniphilum marinum]
MFKLLRSLFDKEMTLLDTTKMQCAVYGDAASGEHEAILCDHGELSSTIEVFGNGEPITRARLFANTAKISGQLTTFFKKADQRLIATYYNDPHDKEVLERAATRLDSHCDVLNFDIKDIHRSDLHKLFDLVRTERFFLTVETGKNAIESDLYKEGAVIQRNKFNEWLGLFGFKDRSSRQSVESHYGQNPMHFNPSIFHSHQDNMTTIEDVLNSVALRYKSMHAKETMRFMHKIFDRYAPADWGVMTTPQTDQEIEDDLKRQMRVQALTPLTKAKLGEPTSFHRVGDGNPTLSKNNQLGDLFLPPLVTQIVGDDIEICTGQGDGCISMNGSFYKTMYVEIPQKKVETFERLIKTVSHLPFMMSWHLEANRKDIDKAVQRGTFIGMASALGAQSCKEIKAAADEIKAYQKADIKSMAMYRLAIVTWADNLEECKKNANSLREKFTKWGEEQHFRSEKANPVQSMIEAMPSMTKPVINRSMPCLVEEALIQMPFCKVASVWDEGTNYFMSGHTAYPVNIGQYQKNFPRMTAVGSTGSGKTFTKNSLLLNTLFRNPYHQLPLLGMCTIGYDGYVFANAVKSALPRDKQHLVITDKPKLTADYAVNIFDTDYGARIARNDQMNNIVGFLEQCLAEPDESRLPTDFSSVIRQVVHKAYNYYSDDGNTAKQYSKGADQEVDAAIEALDIPLAQKRRWTWWNVFDYFHDQGNSRLAYKAQIQAMPTISDLMHVLSEEQGLFDDARSALIDGQSVADILKRRIIDLQSAYQNLCVTTRYNLESARIIILDLESVCPKGSKKDDRENLNDRTSAIMYQLYFMFILKKFLIANSNDDFLADTTVPKKYHAYHFNVIKKEQGIPKIFDLDEFHRASKAYSFKTEVDRIVREMRKYGAEISAASQKIEDFEAGFLEQMGAVFIMDMKSASGDQRGYFKNLLGFTDKDFLLAEQHLTGLHRKYGQPFLLLLQNLDNNSKDRLLIPLYHVAGANKLWALGTDKTANTFRRTLEDKLTEAGLSNPIRTAREVLSALFPSGDIKSVIKAQSALNPNKRIDVIQTELINKCLKEIYKEQINA